MNIDKKMNFPVHIFDEALPLEFSNIPGIGLTDDNDKEGLGFLKNLTVSGLTSESSLKNSSLKEIGNEGLWSLSSAKPGNGVE